MHYAGFVIQMLLREGDDVFITDASQPDKLKVGQPMPRILSGKFTGGENLIISSVDFRPCRTIRHILN